MRLEALGVPIDMQSGIMHASMPGKVRSPNELLEALASTIGVKHGCPLSSTLYGLCIDVVSHYIERFCSSGACLACIAIHILLYDDDICADRHNHRGTTQTSKHLKSILYGQQFVSRRIKQK